MYITIPVLENLILNPLKLSLLPPSARYLNIKPSFLLTELSAVCLLCLFSGQETTEGTSLNGPQIRRYSPERRYSVECKLISAAEIGYFSVLFSLNYEEIFCDELINVSAKP